MHSSARFLAMRLQRSAFRSRVSLLRRLLPLLCLSVLLPAGPAAAEEFPSRTLRIVVAHPPGGGADALARRLSDGLAKIWSTPIIVENRPGAAATIGTRYVQQSAPDGYTLLLGVSSLSTLQALNTQLPFDIVKDFVAVAGLVASPYVLVTGTGSNLASVDDMIKRGSSPSGLTCSSIGVGSPGNLFCDTVNRKEGMNVVHVPYQGTGAMMTDLTAGRVDITNSTAEVVAPHVAAGKLRALAIVGPKRLEAFPGVPTLAELGVESRLGLAEFSGASGWYGVLAPAKTPASAIETLNQAIRKAFHTDENRATFSRTGTGLLDLDAAGFGEFVRDDARRWRAVVAATGGSVAGAKP